tara:strand:+ start:581 stop:1060 length:480 start_codon:yes stop_codon:yes gene_type:complete
MNQLLICLNGIDKRVVKKEINGVLIAKTDQIKIKEKYTFLQADFSSIDDLIKAKQIVTNQIKNIKEIAIVNRDIDLNMISYQYDYEYTKICYQTLTNIIFLMNILINDFNKDIEFILSFDKENHYKVHTDNLNYSIIKYLEALKKDLEKSHQISIKILN